MLNRHWLARPVGTAESPSGSGFPQSSARGSSAEAIELNTFGSHLNIAYLAVGFPARKPVILAVVVEVAEDERIAAVVDGA